MRKKIEEIIRVDHAGEFGARVIYGGQALAFRLKNDQKNLALVKEMKTHEDEHFEFFDEKMKKAKVRPTLMHPIWKIGGFGLGFVTAFLDEKAAMACTTAVEEVIDEHYQSQLRDLDECEEISEEIKELKEKIEKFRQDEIHHRDIGYENGAADLPYFHPLSTFVKGVTKAAVAISKRV